MSKKNATARKSAKSNATAVRYTALPQTAPTFRKSKQSKAERTTAPVVERPEAVVEKPAEDPRVAETKVAETKVAEPKVAEVKVVETKAAENKAAETKAAVETPVVETPAVEIALVETAVAKATVAETSARAAGLIEQLRHPFAETAIEAAERLADLGSANGVFDALVDVLRNEDGYFNLVTRAAAAMALGRLKDDRAAEPLIAATGDAQAEVSYEAVLALGELKAESAVATLQAIVANRDGYFLNATRHAALRALGRIGAASSRPTLEAVVNAGWEDPSLVAAATQAINSL